MKLKGVINCCIMFVCMNSVSVFADLYNRAPDVLPGTTPEMRTTDYWISGMKNPDEVILTPDAI